MKSGSLSQVSFAFHKLFNKNVPPFLMPLKTSYFVKYDGTWQATKSGVETKYGAGIIESPNLKCEQV